MLINGITVIDDPATIGLPPFEVVFDRRVSTVMIDNSCG